MIKKLTVNGITKTISNAELHVEEKNEKEGVLVFNGEVFGENIEKISRIKIGDKFYALSGASEEPVAVPIEGLIEKIYFNTELSAEKVCEILESHQNGCENHEIFSNNSNESRTIIRINFSDDGILIAKLINGQPEMILFSSHDPNSYFAETNGINYIGWNPDFNGCLELNLENQIREVSDYPGAGELNILTTLFSITPTFEEVIDAPSSGVELFNIAELVSMGSNYNDINYANGEDYYKEYRCYQSGYGQMILDAFNAGKKIVYIGKTDTWTANSCSFCQEAFYVGDLDTFNESDRFPNLQYVMVLFHSIQWNSEGKLYKPYTLVFKFPK